MKLKEVREAVIAILRGLFPEYKIYGVDTREPVTRPSFKVMLFPAGCGAMCGGSRERSADVDIYFYATDEHKARAECEEVTEALSDAFYDGFDIGSVGIYLDWDISMEFMENGVLVCQFGLTWYETLIETGEPMEELNLNIDVQNDMEVLSDGSDDAEG